ncbi:hypothetical protein N7474_009273 [Penicillium riverlandense]|uniref:uncharacterized protein n=1 Tax=Penicillium riverlandense TaxID=1903569 RepID=UPI002548E4D9|nr:uncharacterized protein N7474_009273 [Penicillium riverlandense]KAJ5808004.1 hypothetical protein N7474_009273 [Penicillium riverlandense]
MQFKLSVIAFLATTTAIAAPVPAGKEASCASDAINALSIATSEVSSLTKTLDGNGNLIEVGQFIDQDEALVKALDNQKGLLKNTPFFSPLAEATRALEAATGEYFDPILAATPLCGGNLQQLAKTLKDDLSQLVATYSMIHGAPSLPLQGPGSGAESGNHN